MGKEKGLFLETGESCFFSFFFFSLISSNTAFPSLFSFPLPKRECRKRNKTKELTCSVE